MTPEEEAEALRRSVPEETVRELIAQYPPPDTISSRNNPGGYRRDAEDMGIAEVRRHLAECCQRYEQLRREGLRAVNQYDILISSSRRPLEALRTALSLTHNHISYYRTLESVLGQQLELGL